MSVELAEIEVLPPGVQTRVRALQTMDGAGQAAAVTAMLSHSRTGLLAAIAAHDLPQIVMWKQKASAIQEIAKQVRMGKEFQLDAAEFVRRAERGLGVAIREGQERGEIRRQGQVVDRANQHGRVGNGADSTISSSATDFATKAELVGNGVGIYSMTDNVTDEQFEEAVTEARDEGNLSRANVARKAKSKTVVDAEDPLIDAEVEPAPAEPAPKANRLTKHDSTEILANIDGMLYGIVESLPFIDSSEVDPEGNKHVIARIRNSMGSIRKVLKEIENG